MSGKGSRCPINIGSCLAYGSRYLRFSAEICLDISQLGSGCFCQKVQNLSGLVSSLGRECQGSCYNVGSKLGFNLCVAPSS